MDIAKSLKQAFDVAFLKETTMKKVAADKTALVPALVLVGVAAVVTALGYYVFPSTYGGYVFYRPDFAWLVGQAVWSFALSLVSLYLVGYLAVALFKSKLDMNGYVRVMGHGMIVGVTAIVPSLSIVGGIWSLVILWKILSKLGKLEVAEIIVLLVINIVVIGALSVAGIGFIL